MLSAIFSTVAGPLLDHVLAPITDIFKAYFNKEISEAQLREQLMAALVDGVKAVEVAHAEALAKTYASFMDAMKQSVLMQRVWMIVVLSQTFVLFWAQWCAPVLYAYGFMDKGWHAGGTVEWAYLLIGGLLGMGPMVLRSGPGAGELTSRLKAMVGK